MLTLFYILNATSYCYNYLFSQGNTLFLHVKLCKTYVVWKSDDLVVTGMAQESGMEEVTARGKHGRVRSVTSVPHENGHITKHIFLSLLIQGAEDMRTVNC